MPKVLVVVVNEPERRLMARLLQEAQFTVEAAADGLEAMRAAFSFRPDAIVLPDRVPDLSGNDLIRVVRAACDVPIIVISEVTDPGAAARALDAGADDVVDANCSAVELAARLRAAIRRYQREPADPGAEEGGTIRTGGLTIDRENYRVTLHGRAIRVTPTEFRLLEVLALNLGEVVPHSVLLSSVWGESPLGDTGQLRVYVGYLRNKLGDDPADPRYVCNHWGVGYRLARLPVEVSRRDDSAVS
jgi:two-component system KDP operon response regulator KdpE